MAGLNKEFGGGLDPKELSTETIRTASDMEKVLADFTEGMSDAAAARFRGLIGQYKEFEDLKTEIAKNSSIQRLQDELAHFKGTNKQKEALEQELENEKVRVGQLTIRALSSLQESEYKRASLTNKSRMQREKADAIASARVATKEKYRLEWAAAEGDHKKRSELTAKYRAESNKSIKEEQAARMTAIKLQEEAVGKNMKDNGKSMDELVKHPGLKNMGKFTMQLAATGSEGIAKAAEGLKQAHEEAQEEVKRRKEQLEAMKEEEGFDENSAEYQELLAELAEAEKEEQGLSVASSIADSMEKLGNSIKEGIQSSFMGAFQEVEGMLTSYAGKIDARLQGSDESYRDATNKITTLLSISPYVKSKDVIENMRKLVDQGVAYNLEQRAFLGTVSDKIANTFDAFDSNLARLIKLQQADTTAARLGMEAALTRFLNQKYEDTSYLSGTMDQVSSTLIDASSTMTRDMSAEFEYTVHKWMGSLSSVGMSDESINQIVTAINYLATGDVQSLSSNTQLQTLLAMSSAKAGLEYSELLLKGLDSSSTNELLKAMVSYLKDIAQNADNQVVRATYGDLFKLSMSDFKAITNLRESDISNISENSMSYADMGAELSNQFSELITRTTIAEMVDNMYNNAVMGVADDLMTNPVTYGMYKMLEFMDQQKLDINVPFVNVAGFGLGLENTVNGIMRLGLGLSSAMSLVGNILSGLGSGGPFNLDAWGGSEYTQRGSSAAFSTGGVEGQTSSSTYVASGNADDMKDATLNEAVDDAEETSEITNKNSDPGKTIDDLYKTVVSEEEDGYIRSVDLNVAKTFKDWGSNFLHTRDDMLLRAFTDVFGTSSLVTNKKLDVNAFSDQSFLVDYDSDLTKQQQILVNVDNEIATESDPNLALLADAVWEWTGKVDQWIYSDKSTDSSKDVLAELQKEWATLYATGAFDNAGSVEYDWARDIESLISKASKQTDDSLRETWASLRKDWDSIDTFDDVGLEWTRAVDGLLSKYERNSLKQLSGNTFLGIGSVDNSIKSDFKKILDSWKETTADNNQSTSGASEQVDSLLGVSVLQVYDGHAVQAIKSFSDAFTNVLGNSALTSKGVLMTHDEDVSSAISSLTAGITGGIAVSDSTMATAFGTVFGTSALSSEGVLKVSDSTLATKVENIGTFSSSMTISSISEAAEKVLTSAIANVIVEGITGKTNSNGAKSLSDVAALFTKDYSDGRAHVRIQNEDNKRIQVDTEQQSYLEDDYDMSQYTDAFTYAGGAGTPLTLSKITW